MGKKNSKLGTLKVFEAFQDIKVTKHLFYVLFELMLFTICPEVVSEKVRHRAMVLKNMQPISPDTNQ